jgi:hypothetical protein
MKSMAVEEKPRSWLYAMGGHSRPFRDDGNAPWKPTLRSVPVLGFRACTIMGAVSQYLQLRLTLKPRGSP